MERLAIVSTIAVMYNRKIDLHHALYSRCSIMLFDYCHFRLLYVS